MTTLHQRRWTTREEALSALFAYIEGYLRAPFPSILRHDPGLDAFPQHALACQQMQGFGGMLAFELKGGFPAGGAMVNRLQMIRRGVSLGDAESLIQHPASMTHPTYTPEGHAKHGISECLLPCR